MSTTRVPCHFCSKEFTRRENVPGACRAGSATGHRGFWKELMTAPSESYWTCCGYVEPPAVHAEREPSNSFAGCVHRPISDFLAQPLMYFPPDGVYYTDKEREEVVATKTALTKQIELARRRCTVSIDARQISVNLSAPTEVTDAIAMVLTGGIDATWTTRTGSARVIQAAPVIDNLETRTRLIQAVEGATSMCLEQVTDTGSNVTFYFAERQ